METNISITTISGKDGSATVCFIKLDTRLKLLIFFPKLIIP